MDTSSKLDKIAEDIGEIKVTLAEQKIILENHIARTEALEEIVEPIKKHVEGINGVVKALKILALIATIIGTILLLRPH